MGKPLPFHEHGDPQTTTSQTNHIQSKNTEQVLHYKPESQHASRCPRNQLGWRAVQDGGVANKLVGKKLGEGSDSTTFARADLPKETRVIEPGSMVTRDFKPDRLNVHLKEDGTVSHVNHQ